MLRKLHGDMRIFNIRMGILYSSITGKTMQRTSGLLFAGHFAISCDLFVERT